MVGVGQDITELQRAMVETTRVADDLKRLIDAANAPIFGIDTEGRVTEWNRKTEEISGWSKEQSLAKPLVETFIKEEYREDVGRVLKDALEGKETANYEFPLFAKDGQRREILLNATTRLGPNGEVTGVIGVGQDITELRAVMVEQQRVAEDLSRFIETANAPIFGVDVAGRVTEWNRKAVELSGFSKEETMGRHLVDEFIMRDYREKVQLVLQRAAEGEETGNFEFPLITKDGEQIEILLNATPRKDAQGKVTGMVGVGQEITLLRKSMRESEWVADDLTRLIDTANAPIFGIDVQGRVTEWNRKAAAISGFAKEETMGKPLVAHFISEAYRDKVQHVLQLALEGQEETNFEFPLFTKDGVMRILLLNATTRRGADGLITGVIGVGQDITELQSVMQQSQRVADDLSRLIETANAPIFGLDVKGCVNEWNRKVALISGFTRQEVEGRPFVKEFIDVEHRQRVQEALDKALGGEVVGNFELLLYSRSGEKHDILLNATPRCGADGNVMGVVGVGQDITELNRQKSEAIRRAAELRHIFESATAPIVGVDSTGCVTEWNRRVIEVTGYSKDQVVGREFLSFVLESCRAEAHRVLSDAFAGQSTPNFEVLVATAWKGPQDPVTFLLSAAPHMSSAGNILGVICIGQDITHIKELEIKKSQFAATVTHELRSPLHGIIGLSDNLLADTQDKGRMHRSLLMINNCARRLLDLVTNIMDLSTLVQSKRMKLSRDPVHMAKIIEEVIMLTSCAVDKAGHPVQKSTVQLFNKVPNDLPIIEADAHRCTQMLYNLITNALKFTERGQVIVSAYADDVKEFLTVSVTDTGIGIAPQKQDVIFRPFEQEDQTESRRFEGLGLGLSISREVARKHGGSLTVESEPGQGSTFFVSLPYKPFYTPGSHFDEGLENAEAEVEVPWGANSGGANDDREREIECMSMDSTVRREMAGFDKMEYMRSHTSLPALPQTPTQESLRPVLVPLNGREAEELSQSRVLTNCLQRQNAHLQLQVSQLRQRLTGLEVELAQAVQLQACAEDRGEDWRMQAKHLDIDCHLHPHVELPAELATEICLPWMRKR
uniref:histidine kinase n=1 Tax=Alexandrium monilatum TaxID=311494 RepID=A0A7S4V013_9DINO